MKKGLHNWRDFKLEHDWIMSKCAIKIDEEQVQLIKDQNLNPFDSLSDLGGY